jgi:hypothetical protein
MSNIAFAQAQIIIGSRRGGFLLAYQKTETQPLSCFSVVPILRAPLPFTPCTCVPIKPQYTGSRSCAERIHEV